MSNRRGGGGGKGGNKEAATFENFSYPLINLGLNESDLRAQFDACNGDGAQISALQARLVEDAPTSAPEWEIKSKRNKDKPAPAAAKVGGGIDSKSNNNNSGQGARPVGLGGNKPIGSGGFNKNKVFDNRQKLAVNVGVAGQTAPAAAPSPAPENNVVVEKKAVVRAPAPTPPPVTVTVTVAAGAFSYSSITKKKDTEAARKKEEEAKAAEDLIAEKKQQEIDAANAAKKKKEARPVKPKVIKSDAKPEASNAESAAAVAVATANISEAETVSAPQPEAEAAVKKEAEVTTTQIEQSFNNMTTSESVLSTGASESPAPIVSIQVQAQVPNISANNQMSEMTMPDLYKNPVQPHNSQQLVFGEGHVSSNSQQSPPWTGTSWGVDATKPPGLGHKEPAHVQQQNQNQRHAGAKAPSISDNYPPHLQPQQQQQQQQPYYNNPQYNQQMGMQIGMPPNVNYMPNYPANAPYTAPALSPLVPNSMTGVSPPSAPIANNQPAIGAFGQGQGQLQGGQQGQLQGQQGQQQTQQWPGQWMNVPYSPYGYPPPNYGNFMHYPNYGPPPRFPPTRGQQGTYEQQYPTDYQNYAAYDASNAATMQPSQPANKQGKANNGGNGQVNSNTQAQADHIGGQYGYQQRQYDPSYQQQWSQQPMYPQPAPNNQPPGMAGRPIDGNNRPAMNNQHQNFNAYPNNAGGRNNANPQYNVGGLGYNA